MFDDDDHYYGGGDKYNPYFFNSDSRAYAAIDVIQSAKLILGVAETCALAAAERALNADLRPPTEGINKRFMVEYANGLFELAAHIRQIAAREITQEMRDAERAEEDAREKRAKRDDRRA